jgi:hypothetical protein
MSEYLTEQELAERLKLKPSTLRTGRSRRTKGTIPYIRIGNLVRYDWDVVQAWLRSQARGTTGDQDEHITNDE